MQISPSEGLIKWWHSFFSILLGGNMKICFWRICVRELLLYSFVIQSCYKSVAKVKCFNRICAVELSLCYFVIQTCCQNSVWHRFGQQQMFKVKFNFYNLEHKVLRIFKVGYIFGQARLMGTKMTPPHPPPFSMLSSWRQLSSSRISTLF